MKRTPSTTTRQARMLLTALSVTLVLALLGACASDDGTVADGDNAATTDTPPPTPTPTTTATPPRAGDGERGNNTDPGFQNAPVPEWDQALAGTDDQVFTLRQELMGIEDRSPTQQMYLALTGIRLDEPVDDDELGAIAALTDPDADRTAWAAGYATLVDTTAVLAVDADLIEFDFDYVVEADELAPFADRFGIEVFDLSEQMQVRGGAFQLGPLTLDEEGSP